MQYRFSEKKNIPTTRGQAMLIATIFFFIGSLIIVGGIAAPVLREIVILRDSDTSKKSLLYAEGAMEDVVYRLVVGMDTDAIEVVPFASGTATVTIAAVLDGKDVRAIGDSKNAIRKMSTLLKEGMGVSFNYGMQADTGGIIFENSASVLGNVYSNGSVTGAGSNLIVGDAVSAGPGGLLSGVHATGSAYARTINNATVDKDAYYQTISDTIVLGTKFPGSVNQATATMPISDETISQWEAAAQAGGIISSPCPYIIDADATIGPVKIACDLLEIKNNPIVTLGGAVWVEGDIEISNTPQILVDSSLGAKSVPLIAHKLSNTLSSSKIEIENSATFSGSGTPGSYVMLISQNTSASSGGGEKAIRVQNYVAGDLLVYAAHGEIGLENNISLKEVTAYRIRIKNSAQVIYETGLASLLFNSGPGGGFTIDTWEEVP